MNELWIAENVKGGCRAILRGVQEPFIGTEALQRGALDRHQLRTRYRALLPNVYLSTSAMAQPSLEQRISAAWLWSRGAATVAGAAAAALHGTKWIPNDIPVELIYGNSRPPGGVLTRLDALAAATGFKVDDVLSVSRRHPRSPGLRRLETALELVDAGAQSPRESYLRLLLIEAGFPRPQTQIPVSGADGIPVAYIDVGWDEYMVGVEYEGEQHQTDRRRYVNDIHRLEMLEQMGWLIVRVVAEDRRADIVRRVREALAAPRSTLH